MTEWANINIQVLLGDHCHSILLRALKILDGLASFPKHHFSSTGS